jgi:Suppressor of forked protein (Suf)
MEYHVCKATNVATRIFEKGIELFGNEEIEIVLRYLGFLISLNDDASELLFSVVTFSGRKLLRRCSRTL